MFHCIPFLILPFLRYLRFIGFCGILWHSDVLICTAQLRRVWPRAFFVAAVAAVLWLSSACAKGSPALVIHLLNLFQDIFNSFSGPWSNTQRLCGDLVNENRTHFLYFNIFQYTQCIQFSTEHLRRPGTS